MRPKRKELNRDSNSGNQFQFKRGEVSRKGNLSKEGGGKKRGCLKRQQGGSGEVEEEHEVPMQISLHFLKGMLQKKKTRFKSSEVEPSYQRRGVKKKKKWKDDSLVRRIEGMGKTGGKRLGGCAIIPPGGRRETKKGMGFEKPN